MGITSFFSQFIWIFIMRATLLMGYIVLALAQTGISINVVTSKYLLAFLPMFMILACRFFLSSVILAGIMVATKTPIKDPRHPTGTLSARDWVYAVLSGVFAAFLFNLFFVWGLNHTTATAAGIVGSTLPALIAIFAVWLLKEHMNWSKIAALILAMIGIFMLNFEYFSGTVNFNHSYFGDFLVFLAMIPEALYSIINRKLANRMTPLGSSFIANAVGFLTLFPCAYFTGTFDLSMIGASEFGFLMIAAVSSLMFFWAWSWGLAFIPATTAAIFGGVMPVATTVLAILFLHEFLHWYDMFGILMVLGSIVIGTGWWPFLRKSQYVS
jgi:drug/metabolite transporter (DMT)-like permease